MLPSPAVPAPTALRDGKRSFALFAIVAIPTVAHLWLSRAGYSPTDDGLILALARRLVSGEIPHRDFISVRPVGSGLVHAPFLLAGELGYWTSRWFVWCQFGAIAWACVRILESYTQPLGGRRFALAVLLFIATAHYVPPMAWHTIDGVCATCMGVALVRTRAGRARTLGYVLIGLSCICKQSFVVSAAAAFVALGGHRSLRHVVAVLAPGALYVIVLGLAGALGDAVQQLTMTSGPLLDGMYELYTGLNSLVGIVLGILVWLVDRRAGHRAARWARALVVAPLFVGLFVRVLGWPIPLAFPMYSFTLVAYLVVALVAQRGENRSLVAIALGLGVAASLSHGYLTPAIASGMLVIAVMLPRPDRLADGLLPDAALFGITAVALAAFITVRTQYVYVDDAQHLTHDLDTTLPGGRLIRTNERTQAFLADLRRTSDAVTARGRRYAVVPDAAGWWAFATQRNPLDVDWWIDVELGFDHPALVHRALNALEAQRGRITMLVEKYDAGALARELAPVSEEDSSILSYLRAHWREVGETAFSRGRRDRVLQGLRMIEPVTESLDDESILPGHPSPELVVVILAIMVVIRRVRILECTQRR